MSGEVKPQQEVYPPGENVTVDALTFALESRDAEARRANQAETELVRMFDELGFSLRRLGRLKDSTFWQQHGPVDPGTVLTTDK